MPQRTSPQNLIAFQGEPGAYSDLACRQVFPRRQSLPCETFEDTIAAVRRGRATLAMLPIENSVAGRVADIHHLLPDSNLHIIGEHYQRVNHHLLAVKGAKLSDLKIVRSHVHALSQCRKMIRGLGLKAEIAADTAGSAAEVARRGDKTVAAIASALAGKVYGLTSLKANIEDAGHNTTRFLVMSKTPKPAKNDGLIVTTFVFRVRNVPAALFKAMGGFRHQRHQHDQARKLHGRRQLHRDAILCRCRGPSRRAPPRPRPRRAALLLGRGAAPRRLPRPRL